LAAEAAGQVTDLSPLTKKHSPVTTYLIYTLAVEFAAELQASLQEFTASGIVEVRENGGCVAPFSGVSWEVRADGEKPLLHLWCGPRRELASRAARGHAPVTRSRGRFGQRTVNRIFFLPLATFLHATADPQVE